MTQTLSNPKEVGLRFKSVRSLVPLNRKDFCDKHGLNRFTVQSWEIGRNFSRSKNIAVFCDALAKEGIFCTTEWLLNGVGDAPAKLNTRKTMSVPVATRAREVKRQQASEEEVRIQAEIEFFKNNQPESVETVVAQVADNLMEPYHSQGDFVGGPLVKGDEIRSLVGKICLIALDSETFVVRRLRTEGNRFLLVPEDPSGTITALKKVTGAAEIIWQRKVARFANV